MTRNTHRQAGRLQRQILDTMIAVPQVLAHRTGRMLISGHSPSAADLRELRRMGEEKSDAFVESWTAMAAQAMTVQFQFAAATMQAATRASSWWMPPFSAAPSLSMAEMTRWSSQWQSAALDVASKGLAPVRRRAMANAARLRVT